MSNNIEILAKFDVDDSAIITKIANNKKIIEELKNANKEYQIAYSNGLKIATKDIEAQVVSQNKLTAELKEGNITQSVYTQLIEDSNKQIKQSQSAINTLTAEYELNARAIAVNEQQVKALQNENRGLSTSYQAIIYAQNGILENYSNEGKSIQELRDDNIKLTKIRNQVRDATNGESEEIIKLNALIDTNTKAISNNSTEDEKRIGNIGQYKEAVSGAFDEIKNGNIKGAFESIKESASGLFKTLLANPFLAVIAGVLAAGKAIFDFNDSIKESNKLLENLGLDKKLRPQIEGVAKSFDIAFKDVAGAVDQILDLGLAKDQADALEQIKKGLVTAPDSSAFISSLESNAQAAKNLGLNLSDVIALQQTFEETGSSAESTFGALEKAQLNLTKTNKDVSDALSKTLGDSFSKELLSKVQNGTITYTDALNQIFEKGKELKINSQEQADLQVALFGKSAVAAGGYEQILNNVAQAQDRQNEKLTAQQQATLDLTNANQELEKALSNAFEIGGFGSSWDSLKASAILALSDIINYLAELKDDIQPLIDVIGVILVNSFHSVKAAVVSTFEVVGGVIKGISEVLKAFLNVFKSVITGDFQGAKKAFINGFFSIANVVDTTFARVKNTIIDSLKSIVQNVKPILSALGIDVDKLLKKLDGFKSIIPKKAGDKIALEDTKTPPKEPVRPVKEPIEQKAIDDAKKKAEEARKRLEEAVKRELELAKQLVDEKIRLANLELNQFILNNASKLANEKVLTQALLDEEKRRLDEIAKKKQAIDDQELISKDAQITQEIEAQKIKNNSLTGLELQNGQELIKIKQQQLDSLAIEYYNKEIQLKQETEKAKLDVDNLYSNQLLENKKLQTSLQYQQELLDLETNGATQFEIKTAQLDQQYEMEAQKYLDDIYNKFNLKVEADAENLTIQHEIDAAQEQLQAEIDATKDANKKIALQNNLAQLNQLEQNAANQKVQITKLSEAQKLDVISNMLGSAKSLFAENTVAYKAIAIAQATINTYQSAVAAYAAGLSVGGPAGLVLGPVSAGIAVAAGLANIAKISGIKFKRGGLAANLGGLAVGNSHANGGIAGLVDGTTPIEFEDGEAIINKKSTKKHINLLSKINQDGGGVAFANGGIVGGSIQSIQNQITQGLDTKILSETIGKAVMEGAASGTAIGSQKGISDLNTNNLIEQNANF